MASPVPDELLGDANMINLECSYCGRTRWRKPSELARRGVTLHTPLYDLGRRLSCPTCQDEGRPGKTISVQAYYDRDFDRARIEAAVLRNQIVLSAELPEISA